MRTIRGAVTQTPGACDSPTPPPNSYYSTSDVNLIAERTSCPTSELAKNVNCPAPPRCISGRSGLIGVVPGACRFQQATDYTKQVARNHVPFFEVSPVTPGDAIQQIELARRRMS